MSLLRCIALGSPALALAVALSSACASPPRRAARSIPPLPPGPREVTVARGETACALAGRTGVDVEALRAANGWKQPAEQPLAPGRASVPARSPLRHRIRAGETLHRLSLWYGLSASQLAASNGIDDPDRVNAGIWLSIPPGARTGCAPAAPIAQSGPHVLARSGPRVVARSSPPVAAARPRAEPETPALPVVALKPRPVPAPAEPAAPPVSAEPPPAPAADTVALERADAALQQANGRYDAADFEAVLGFTEQARDALPPDADDPATVERRARASWLEGLANAGLDRREEAVASLREALALRPSLRDEQSLSPRILGLLEAPDETPGEGR